MRTLSNPWLALSSPCARAVVMPAGAVTPIGMFLGTLRTMPPSISCLSIADFKAAVPVSARACSSCWLALPMAEIKDAVMADGATTPIGRL